MENSLKIKLYIGVVAEDKLYNQKFIKTYVNTLLPFFNGKLKDYTAIETIKIQNDNSGAKEKISVKTSNIITAEYFGLFSNRTLPPDVRKGEQVIIFQLEDLNSYFWIPLSRDDNLRRLEHLRFHVSDSKDPKKSLNEDNMYYIELDTLYNKSITLKTCKADGEIYRYTIKINAKENYIELKDDSGNIIDIDSNNPKITIRNRNDAFVILNKDDIYVQNHDKSFLTLIKDNITVQNSTGSFVTINGDIITLKNKTGSNIKLNGEIISFQNKAGSNIQISGDNVNISNIGNTTISSTEAVTLSAPNINLSTLPNICPHK